MLEKQSPSIESKIILINTQTIAGGLIVNLIDKGSNDINQDEEPNRRFFISSDGAKIVSPDIDINPHEPLKLTKKNYHRFMIDDQGCGVVKSGNPGNEDILAKFDINEEFRQTWEKLFK